MKKARRITAALLSATMMAAIITAAPFSVSAAENSFDVVAANEAQSPDTAQETFTETKPVKPEKPEDSVGTSYEADGFTYTVNDNKVTITGCDKNKSGAVAVPDTIDGYAVSEIGESAFAGRSRIKSITLPASITTIGDCAFKDDVSLASITLGGAKNLGYNLFEGCDSLTSLTIPGTVTEVNGNTWGNAPLAGSSITSVVVEEGIDSIPAFLCAYASALTSVTLPEKDDIIDGYVIGEYAFFKTSLTNITLPNSITEIRSNAFNACSLLTSVTIPENTQEIGDNAFAGCSRIKSIALPASVTTIGDCAFKDDVSLASITLGGAKNLGYNLFEGCDSLTSLTIPGTVTEVNGNTWGNAPLAGSSITSVVVEEGIDSIPAYLCAYASALTSVTLPEKDDIIDGYVIGEYAFFKTSLTNITLPNSITEIRSNAFNACSLLTSVTIPENTQEIGDNAFAGCSRIKSIALPASVTTIGDCAFKDDVSLASITLGGAKNLGYNLFEGCDSLTSLTIPGTVTEVNGNTWGNAPLAGSSITSVVVEEGIDSIPAYLCAYASALTSVTLPEKDDIIDGYVIGDFAFYNTSLTNITLPNSITEIRSNAFNACSLLTSVTIPENTQEIGDNAFAGCSRIKSIALPASVTTIGDCAFKDDVSLASITLGGAKNLGYNLFEGCDSLTSLTIPGTVTEVNGNTWGNAPLAGSSITSVVVEEGIDSIPAYLCAYASALTSVTLPEKDDIIDGYVIGEYAFFKTSLTNITLPNSITEIRSNAFNACSLLTSVTLTENAKTIGDNAFEGCSRLASVTLGKALKTIGNSAFAGCSRIKSIALPASVTTIGDCAFKDDVSLASITLGGAKNLGYNLFEGCDSLTSLTIPGTVTEVNGNTWGNAPLAGSSITSVVVEEGIDSIPAFLCAYASALTSVTLPEKEDTIDGYVIGDYAFYNCTFLNEINIPQSITSINSYAFANCQNLGTFRLPSSIKNLDTTVFENSAVEKCYIDKEDSSVALVLIDNEIPYIADDPGIKDSNTKYLDFSKSDYRATTSSVTTSGLVTLAVDYDFKAIRKNSVSELSLRIKLPSAVAITPNSVKMNGESLDYWDEDGFLIIPLSEKSGSVRFTVQPNDATYLLSYAQIYYRYNGFERTETINIVNMATKLLTLNIPNRVSSKIVTVNGVTNPNSLVRIYLNDELYDSCSSSALGNYSMNVLLRKASQGDVYKITAKTLAGEDHEQSIASYVMYDINSVKIKTFKMYFEGNETDLIALNGTSPTVLWGGGQSYTFILSFSDNSKVRNVKVISNNNDVIKKLNAVYDSKNDCFVATGFKDYLPGTISAEYKIAADYSRITGTAVNKEDGYSLGENNEVNGYLTRLSFDDGSEIFSFEEYEDNVEIKPSDNLMKVNDNGNTYFISKNREWYYRDNGIFLGKELYRLKENGKYGLFRYGIGFFEDDMNISDPETVGAKSSQTGKNKVVESAKKIAVDFGDEKAEKAFEEYGLGDYYQKTKILNQILSERVYDSSQDDAIYMCLNDMINKIAANSSSYDMDLQNIQAQLELYRIGKNMQHLNHVLDNYIDNSVAISGDVLVPGSNELDSKFKNDMKEQMKQAVDSMSDIEGKVANQNLSTIINIMSKHGWFSDSWMENMINQAMDDYEDSGIVFSPKYLIDPSGYVYEGAKENRVSGVKATIYYKENEDAEPVIWDASEYDQQNPLYSNAEGNYAWDVPEGLWQVVFEKDGYETAETEWLPVPPEQLEVNVGITSKSAPKVETVNAYNEEIQIIFDQYVDVSTVNTSTVSVSQQGKTLKGIIEAVDALPSASDSGMMLSNQFNLVLYDSVSGKINCTIKNVKNYGGKAMADPYSAEVDIVREISGLMAESSVSIPYKDTVNVTVKAVPAEAAAGKTMSVKSENAFLASVPESVSFNDAGEAVIPVESLLPGETEIRYIVDGTTAEGSFKVVSEANLFADITNTDEPEEKQEPVVLGVRINPSVVSLVNSESCQLHAFVYGFYQPSQEVSWAVSGNRSDKTAISEDGTLYIADNETADNITITAASKEDPAKSVSITVVIYQIQIVSTVSSVTVTMEKDETRKLMAYVTGANNPNQKVVWSVGGNNSAETIINENGEVTIGNNETAKTIIVRAASVDDPEKYGEFAIDIDQSGEQQPLLGDVDGDGMITINDVSIIQEYIAEYDTPNPNIIIICGDVDGDGAITIDDATLIQMYIAELIDSFNR